MLIPEVPFGLDGPAGFLEALHQRVKDRGSAVVVVAEGAGQTMIDDGGRTDASGNTRLGDIGQHLKIKITEHFAGQGSPLTLKYFDPGYLIRSVPPIRTIRSTACGWPRRPPTPAWRAARTWWWVVGTTASFTCRSPTSSPSAIRSHRTATCG